MLRLADNRRFAGSVLTALGCLVALAPGRATAQTSAERRLSGSGALLVRVSSPDGTPLAAALGSVVKVEGLTDHDPACHPHCGQHAVSGADGLLRFDELCAGPRYSIYIEAKDCVAKTIVVEPRSSLAIVETTLRSAWANDPRTQIHGQVLKPDGNPAAGAKVVVQAALSSLTSRGRDMETITDKEGRFTLDADSPWGQTVVNVEAGQCVPNVNYSVKPGGKINTLQLVEGATIRGRVLYKARPVAGVDVSLVLLPAIINPRGARGAMPTERSVPRHATTDASGRYTFDDVVPQRECRLFVPMKSVAAENLFSHRQELSSRDSGQATEAAEINLHPAHRLQGRIVLSDNKKSLPRGVTAVVERRSLGDIQEAEVNSDGQFEFAGVPSESVVLSFYTPASQSIPGYRLSRKNHSVDGGTGATLCGRVDADTELLVLFDPGAAPRYVAGEAAGGPNVVGVVGGVRGGAVVQQVVVQNGRQMIVRNIAVNRGLRARDDEPLAGASEKDLPREK